jgi:hypothetical protein
LVIKKDLKDHSVLVKEATFQDDSDNADEDFDPFCCEYEEPDAEQLKGAKIESLDEAIHTFIEESEGHTSIKIENLEDIKPKRKTKSENKMSEENKIKPLKKRAIKTRMDSEDDDLEYGLEDCTDEDYDTKRSSKGPPVSKDLNYMCLEDQCANLIFSTAFAFVDHMEVSKTSEVLELLL